ncbi:MAG: deoxyribonuclease V [Chlamydiales bacterium]
MRKKFMDITPAEARAIQDDLRSKVIISPLKMPPTYIAGADVSFVKHSTTLYAAVVIFAMPNLSIIDQALGQMEITFPYIPGYLSFREAPVIIQTFNQLKLKPDVLICDGQGIAHPRRLGLACHLGILLDIPTIGCAKNRLIGEYSEPDNFQWAQSPLLEQNEQVGVVLRTKDNVKPLFISPGHKTDCATSVEVIKASIRKYRNPEPIRYAHHLVNSYRKKFSNESQEKSI